MLNGVHTVNDLLSLAKTLDNDDELLQKISTDLIEEDYDFALKVAKRILSDLSASFKDAVKTDKEDNEVDGVQFFTEIHVTLDCALRALGDLSL